VCPNFRRKILSFWFHSSAFSNFWKIGKIPIYFPKFGKSFFQKLEKSFFQKWENNVRNFPNFGKSK